MPFSRSRQELSDSWQGVKRMPTAHRGLRNQWEELFRARKGREAVENAQMEFSITLSVDSEWLWRKWIQR